MGAWRANVARRGRHTGAEVGPGEKLGDLGPARLGR